MAESKMPARIWAWPNPVKATRKPDGGWESWKDYEPINCLVTDLSIQGNYLVEISGYMAALWHMRVLDDHRMPSRIADARTAIKKASDALDAYEAALSKAKGGT